MARVAHCILPPPPSPAGFSYQHQVSKCWRKAQPFFCVSYCFVAPLATFGGRRRFLLLGPASKMKYNDIHLRVQSDVALVFGARCNGGFSFRRELFLHLGQFLKLGPAGSGTAEYLFGLVCYATGHLEPSCTAWHWRIPPDHCRWQVAGRPI